MISNKQLHELIRFGISGVAGFLVDAGIVALCTKIFSLDPILAQLFGFSVAVTITWLFNRHWTFAEHASDRWAHEWARYIAANSFGAIVNNGIFTILILSAVTFKQNPILAVAIGSLTGMIFNFLSSKTMVFNSRIKL